MAGRYVTQVELRTNIEKVLEELKETQDRVDKLERKDYKINLDIDTKTLESAIQKLDKMLDSLGKGTGDFKQFENLSKQLESITSDVKDFSKAFGKVDDSGTKTLLSSIQNIDKSLSELSQNILNVNKNMSNMGGNTSGAVKQVENISNAYQDAAKEAEKLADAQSKIGQKTNISSGDFKEQSTEIDLYHNLEKRKVTYDEIIDRIQTIVSLKEKEKSLSKTSDDTKLYQNLYDENDINWAGDTEGTINRISDRLKEIYIKYNGKISLINENDIQEAAYLLDILKGAGESPNLNKSQEKFYQNKKFSNDSLFDNIHVDSQKTGEIDKINTELSETYRWFNQLEGVSLNENIANEIKSLISDMQIGGKTANEYANDLLKIFNIEVGSNSAIEQQNKLQSELKETESQAEKTAMAVKEISSTTSQDQKKDAFPNADSTASVEKIADGFKEVKQNTEQATEVTEKYQRVLSQVGELGVDAKVSAMYQRNDGQLESVSWKAKRDDQGQILYDKNGNIDYDFNSTVISKYEQLEKIITTADNKLRDLQKSLKDTQNLNSNASTKNIEEQIQYQKDYIQLLEQTVKAISQQDEYLLYEQQIIDARAKAEKEYNLNQGTKSDISNAKQLASDEQKRQKSIEQTNRLLNKQQIIIDGIEKSYSKAANNDLDKAVNSQSDLAELEKKKNLIQFLLNGLKNEDRNSSNEKEFLQVEKLIAEYKQLAKDKLKANNPSKQELGGQELDVLLANQVTQYNKLISQSEKYGDATKEITNELKAQRDLIAEQDKNGVYVARSKKADGSEITANDYYDARDNYKISKSIFSSYETVRKEASELQAIAEAKKKSRQLDKEATQNSVDNALKDQLTAWKSILSIREKINSTSDVHEIEVLKQIKSEYQQNYIEADKILKTNSDLYDKETQLAKLEQIRIEANNKITSSQEKQISSYENKLSTYQAKKGAYDATIARFKDGGWTSDEYLKNVQAVKDAVKKYEDLLSNIKAKGGITSEEDVQKLKEYESEIKKTISTVTNMSAAEKGYNFVSAQKELDKIHKLLAENSKMSSEAKAKIQAYYREIESGNPSMSLDKIHGEILKIYNAEVEAGRAGRSFFDTLKNSGFHQLAAQMAGMFGFYDVINLGKEGLSIVRELNTALTEMRKVSDESLQSLKNYQNTTFDVADAVGTTAKQIQASTADYMRLGESLDEAAESAKTANVLLNVSEFDNIEDATKSLVAMGQAYKDLDKMTIVDKLNEVGNNYAISTDELATALQKSAATLSLMGNTIDEAASLVTTANATIQDADSVSAGLRTISLRLVGTEEAEEELSAMNEEVDAFVKATNSKKQQIIKDYTAVASNNYQGFDILDSNGNYKNTYEILLGIAKVYKEIQEQDKKLGTNHATALIEELAGKNRSNIASAILQDPTQLEAVKKSSEEALGSAKNELNSYLDSIDGKMAQLENRAQEFWFKVIDSETIKNGIGLLSTLLKGATDFVDTVGLLPTILAPIAAILGKGKSIQRFCPVW